MTSWARGHAPPNPLAFIPHAGLFRTASRTRAAAVGARRTWRACASGAPASGFRALGAALDTAARLATLGMHEPTPAQEAAVPTLLGALDRGAGRGADRPRRFDAVTVAAETGSGKTLAYLLPYYEAARARAEARRARGDVGVDGGAGESVGQGDEDVAVVQSASDGDGLGVRPLRAVVIVPSRELCWQVARMVTEYFPDLPSPLVFSGGKLPYMDSSRTAPDALAVGIPRPIVCTPSSLLQYYRFESRDAAAEDVPENYIVIDEADMLLSGSFLRDIERVLDRPEMKPFARRKNAEERMLNTNTLVFVGATFPHWTGERVKSVITWMRKKYPKLHSIDTDLVHRRLDTIRDEWHYLPELEDRQAELRRILAEDCRLGDKVMVFCSQANTAESLYGELREDALDAFPKAVRLHKLVPSQEREDGLAAFRDGEATLLVCTDLASRGLDLGSVTRVIEFEFSTNVVGYLHRIGRTARAGASGATNHFYDDGSKDLADAIRSRAHDDAPVVDGVFSRGRSFRRKLRKRQREEAPPAENANLIA